MLDIVTVLWLSHIIVTGKDISFFLLKQPPTHQSCIQSVDNFSAFLSRYEFIQDQIHKATNQAELASAWDRFWRDLADYEILPPDSFLPACLKARHVQTVLAVGNGLSPEAQSLAEAGYGVDVLDISPYANAILAARLEEETDPTPCRQEDSSPSRGGVRIHTGDFRDASICPGPYDAIVCRRTLQYLPDTELPTGLNCLAARLSAAGLLVLESLGQRAKRHLYYQHLKSIGFGLCVDIQLESGRPIAPKPISLARNRKIAWVLSTVG